MRQLPDLDWPVLVALQAALGAASAFLSALIGGHILGMIVALIIPPITAVLFNLIAAAFFYYTFMFFFDHPASFKSVCTHMLFASIPVSFTAILAGYIPLINLLGVAAAAALLAIGFTHNYGLPQKKIRNLMIGIVAIYALILLAQFIRWQGGREHMRLKATPESIDILEKELNH